MEELYFIGIIPEPSVQDAVTAIKKDFKRLYHSSHALKSPPHITLIPPFKCTSSEIAHLSDRMAQFCENICSFKLSILNFGAFPPRVIFLQIVSDVHLYTLQNTLEQHLTANFHFIKPSSRSFHPHMTVAFKDLTKLQFNAAWPIYAQRSFETEFKVRELALLHYKQTWQVHKCFRLGPKIS